nr:uncharacterized protein LOC117273386 [Nicotiana tomentosiformis]
MCHRFFGVLKKDNDLQCTSEYVQDLKELKAYLSSPPLLSKPEPGKHLIVYLAVSKVAVSAILVRENKNPTSIERRGGQPYQTSRSHQKYCNRRQKCSPPSQLVNRPNRGRRTPGDKKEAKKLRIQAARYNIIHNDLYKRIYDGPLAKCLGPNQTRRVLEEVHEGHCGAHSGNRALVKCLIRAGYYWPTTKKEAPDFMRKCKQCQKYTPMIHQVGEHLPSVTSPWPFIK